MASCLLSHGVYLISRVLRFKSGCWMLILAITRNFWQRCGRCCETDMTKLHIIIIIIIIFMILGLENWKYEVLELNLNSPKIPPVQVENCNSMAHQVILHRFIAVTRSQATLITMYLNFFKHSSNCALAGPIFPLFEIEAFMEASSRAGGLGGIKPHTILKFRTNFYALKCLRLWS